VILTLQVGVQALVPNPQAPCRTARAFAPDAIAVVDTNGKNYKMASGFKWIYLQWSVDGSLEPSSYLYHTQLYSSNEILAFTHHSDCR
jgi:hypothetical protein